MRDGAHFGRVRDVEFGVLEPAIFEVSGAELCRFGHVCRVPERKKRVGLGGAERDMGDDCVDRARAPMVHIRDEKAGAASVTAFEIFARADVVC